MLRLRWLTGQVLRSSACSMNSSGGCSRRRRSRLWPRWSSGTSEEDGNELGAAVTFGGLCGRRSSGAGARVRARGGVGEGCGCVGSFQRWRGGRGDEVGQQWCGGGALLR